MKKYANVFDRKEVAQFGASHKESIWCPDCDSPRTLVYDSRFTKIAGIQRRRRACLDCGSRFTTKEIWADEIPLSVCPEGQRHAAWYAKHIRITLVCLCAAIALASAACASEYRSHAALDAFQRSHPCPSTGLTYPLRWRGAGGHWRSERCPGYVVDHVCPLECGGSDNPGNMSWQTIADGKIKDRWELSCRTCR